jgi:hypothetical protein
MAPSDLTPMTFTATAKPVPSVRVRRAEDRGHFDFGWLDTAHTFSFGDYHAPEHMGFRALRVINEDRVAPGRGFGLHPHRDMEIVTWVLAGELAHRDSLGHGSVIRPGEAQRMTAGTGLQHSEFNPSAETPVHFLQIWLMPRARGLTPSYDQRRFDLDRGLCLIASPDGRDGSLSLEAHAELHAGRLAPHTEAHLPLAPGRFAWVQVARGQLDLAGHTLRAGDGAAISNCERLSLRALEASEVLVFDLA